MVDLTPFRNQISAAQETLRGGRIDGDSRTAFLNEIKSSGFKTDIIVLDKLTRVDDPQDSPGDKTGWYVYNEFEDKQDSSRVFAVGVYGSWRGNPDKIVWTSRSQNFMTTAERLNLHAAMEQAALLRDQAQRKLQDEAAMKSLELWQSATPGPHQYLERKKIKAYDGVRVLNQSLMIPVLAGDKITSLQFIMPDGSKKFLTGGRVKGCCFKIKGDDKNIFICEGYATGASVAEATGGTVYISFNAGNLFEVAGTARAENPGARIIVAGDDDKAKDHNTGRIKAQQAADAIGAECILPECSGKDFNDMATEYGLDAVRHRLCSETPIKTYEPPTFGDVDPPPGALGEIFRYYMATSGNNQPGFAIQTALAIGSIVCARSFKSSLENFTSLYFLNVGKSGTGKEHSKTVLESVLDAAGISSLVAGDGYTSSGAVFSALLDRPRHVTVIDEFGRYLEAASQKGAHNQKEANTKLMEAIGRCHTVMRPPSYSTMTLKKDAADAIKNRKVLNPAITLMAMTTPVTLFKNLNHEAIKDGFVNRFIINISDAERSLRVHKPPVSVPQSIVDWIGAIQARGDAMHTAAESPKTEALHFTDEALKISEDFQRYAIAEANALEMRGMGELPGRLNELAMRVSLVLALSRDSRATKIDSDDMTWAVAYVKNCYEKTKSALKISIHGSEHEGAKVEVLAALRNRKEPMKFADMLRTPPYSKYQRKELAEILTALVESELIEQKNETTGRGRPSIAYWAV